MFAGVGDGDTVNVRRGRRTFGRIAASADSLPADKLCVVRGGLEEGGGQRFRLLIADDSEEVRGYLRRLLELEFEIVGEAADGVEAIELVGTRQPDVLLLDLAMPGMDGLQVLERVRARNGSVRVVVFTGYGAEFAEAARQLGADDYIEKGAPVSQLLERLRRVCQ
jgi:CheY-like chemotaxis protein